MSIRLLLSSLLPLNSARPPSPCRITRSAGAIRSIAPVSDGRRLRLRGLQQRADLGQVLQSGKLRSGAAFGMAAVRQHLPSDLLRQEAQRTGQEAGVLRQCDGRGDQALQRGERPCIQLLGRQRRRQAAGIGDQPAISLWRNASSAVAAKKS